MEFLALLLMSGSFLGRQHARLFPEISHVLAAPVRSLRWLLWRLPVRHLGVLRTLYLWLALFALVSAPVGCGMALAQARGGVFGEALGSLLCLLFSWLLLLTGGFLLVRRARRRYQPRPLPTRQRH